MADVSSIPADRLIRLLISAAYDTGYYSGQGEDGERHHVAAIERREELRRYVLLRLKGMRGSTPVCSCGAIDGDTLAPHADDCPCR